MKFLGRAKKFLQDLATEPQAQVQHFNVMCASGHRVRGERTDGYQALRCPACGEGVFVLPRSPLPAPAASSRTSESARARFVEAVVEEGPVELTDAAHVAVDLADREPARAEVEIVWEDAPAEATGHSGAGPSSRPARPRGEEGESAGESRPGARPGTGDRRGLVRSAEPSSPRPNRPKPAGPALPGSPGAPGVEAEPDVARHGPRTSQRRPAPGSAPQRPGELPKHPQPEAREDRSTSSPTRRRPSHHLLIFVFVTILVVATVAWRVWRSRRQEFPLVAEKGRTEGIPALDQGKFDRAYQLLAAAKSAVEALGGAVEGAGAISHAADEAKIFVDLAPLSLEDMLAEARRTAPETWASKFDTLYKGRSILIDSWITSAAEPGKPEGYALAYRVFPPGEASQFREGGAPRESFAEVDLAGFAFPERSPRPGVGDRVVFGARLASFRYESDGDRWVVRLEPRSGVFIEHTGALQAIGWPVEMERDPPAEDRFPR